MKKRKSVARKFVCGIPVPTVNNFKRNTLRYRFKSHSETSGHSLACSQRPEEVKTEPEEQISLVNFFEENEEITTEPTDEQIEEQISKIEENEAVNIEPTEEEKMINYIENRLKPRFPWLQLSEGKLFCTVRNIQGQVHIASTHKNLGY